jgi:hypothetical protein
VGHRLQTLVDEKVSAADAPLAAEKVCLWLVAEGIVEPLPIGAEFTPIQYRLGSEAGAAIGADEGGEAIEPCRGLQVQVGRMLFLHGKKGCGSAVQCPACGCPASTADAAHAAQEWYYGRGGAFRCPRCREPAPIQKWRIKPAWGFGHLGLSFWNCPPLKPGFVGAVAAQLGSQPKLVCAQR